MIGLGIFIIPSTLPHVGYLGLSIFYLIFIILLFGYLAVLQIRCAEMIDFQEER